MKRKPLTREQIEAKLKQLEEQGKKPGDKKLLRIRWILLKKALLGKPIL